MYMAVGTGGLEALLQVRPGHPIEHPIDAKLQSAHTFEGSFPGFDANCSQKALSPEAAGADIADEKKIRRITLKIRPQNSTLRRREKKVLTGSEAQLKQDGGGVQPY